MKTIIYLLVFVLLLPTSVTAMDITAPDAPDSAEKYMPDEVDSFGEGLWYVIKSAISDLQPDIADAAGICLSLITAVMLLSVVAGFAKDQKQVLVLVSTLLIGVMLIKPSNTLVRLGTQTITELAQYGKLLLPVMTTALAAQGGTATSTTLYTGTAFFSTLLTNLVSNVLVPMLYIYLVLCIANSALGEELLKNLKKFVKWLMTWGLKIILYVFTGFLGITGVVSGTADAAAIKATKMAISGVVPVVGGIISDASETILVSAGIMKSAAGVYGILAMIAVFIGPFFQIGIQYLMLKLTASICDVFGSKNASELIHDFSGAMGLVLAMTGTICLLLLISTVCFMKGVA